MKFEKKKEHLYLYFYPNRPSLKYTIPLSELNNIAKAPFVGNHKDGLYLDNISEKVVHLMKTKGLSKKDILQIMSIIKGESKESNIDWDLTERAIGIYFHYLELFDDFQEEREGPFIDVIATSAKRIQKRKQVIEEIRKIYNI